MSENASLLGIPAELRLQILSYLLPNVKTIPHRSKYGERESSQVRTPGRLRRASVESLDSDAESVDSDASFVSSSSSVQLSYPYKPLRIDEDRCWPQVLRVNRQIYGESFDLIYRNRNFNIKVDIYNVSFLNENYLIEVDPADTSLDERLGPVESLHVTLNAECAKDYVELPTRDGAYRNLKCRVHCFVDCLRRIGTVKNMVIDIKPQRIWNWQSRPAPTLKHGLMERYLISLLKPFESVYRMDEVGIHIRLDTRPVDGTKVPPFSVRPALHQYLSNLRSKMCNDTSVALDRPLQSLWFYVSSIRLGNDLNLEAPFRSVSWYDWDKYGDEWEWKCGPGTGESYFQRFCDDLFKEGADPNCVFRDIDCEKRSYEVILDAAFVACEQRDISACRKEIRAIYLEWVRARQVLLEEWKLAWQNDADIADILYVEVMGATEEEREIASEAWAAVDAGLIKVRAALMEAAARLEPEKNEKEREKEIDRVFAPALAEEKERWVRQYYEDDCL